MSGILRSQDDMLPVIETMINAARNRPADCTVVITVEDTEPFQIIWFAIGDAAGTAQIRRGRGNAILGNSKGSGSDDPFSSPSECTDESDLFGIRFHQKDAVKKRQKSS